VSACAAHVNMECWAHHNINLSVVIINQRYQHLRDAWEQENDKDDLKMDLQGLERQFWLGTEAGPPTPPPAPSVPSTPLPRAPATSSHTPTCYPSMAKIE
jgi:hypothetical protein